LFDDFSVWYSFLGDFWILVQWVLKVKWLFSACCMVGYLVGVVECEEGCGCDVEVDE